jgi:hypothetical protein
MGIGQERQNGFHLYRHVGGNDPLLPTRSLS